MEVDDDMMYETMSVEEDNQLVLNQDMCNIEYKQKNLCNNIVLPSLAVTLGIVATLGICILIT